MRRVVCVLKLDGVCFRVWLRMWLMRETGMGDVARRAYRERRASIMARKGWEAPDALGVVVLTAGVRFWIAILISIGLDWIREVFVLL